MDRCAEASHQSVRMCTLVYISPYSQQMEGPDTAHLSSWVWRVKATSPPLHPNLLPLEPVKNPLFSCTLPEPSAHLYRTLSND